VPGDGNVNFAVSFGRRRSKVKFTKVGRRWTPTESTSGREMYSLAMVGKDVFKMNWQFWQRSGSWSRFSPRLTTKVDHLPNISIG
jgi:hypothetical protein